jgi:hypothetical protein
MHKNKSSNSRLSIGYKRVVTKLFKIIIKKKFYHNNVKCFKIDNLPRWELGHLGTLLDFEILIPIG